MTGTRRARAAAIALLLSLLALAWLLLVAPLRAARDRLDDEIAVVRASHERLYIQVAATDFRTEQTVLADATPALAAARLQAEVEGIVEGSGGTIERLEATAPPPARGRQRIDPVRVSLAFAGTAAQLRQALLDIESAPVAIIVDYLVVLSDRGEDDRLRVEMTVRAFRRRGQG